jgi:hypothetical protein
MHDMIAARSQGYNPSVRVARWKDCAHAFVGSSYAKEC